MPLYRRFYTAKRTRGPWSSLLSEEFLDLLHPGLGAGVVPVAVCLADRLEFAQQLPLPVGQIHRGFHDDVAKQVALFPTAHTANAFAAQAKYLSRLSFGGDSDLLRIFLLMDRRPPRSTLCPYTTLLRCGGRARWP